MYKDFLEKKNWNVSILGKDLKEKVFEESVWVEKIYFGKLLLEKTEKEKKLIEKVLEKKIFGKWSFWLKILLGDMIDDLCDTTIVRGLMVCVLLGQDVMSAVAKRIHITVPATLQ